MVEQRIPLADVDTMDERGKKLLDQWTQGRTPLNIFLTYAQNGKLNKNWARVAAHVFMNTSLSERQREIVVLRSSWLCTSDYEFLQHVRIVRAKKLMTEDELLSIKDTTPASHWSEEEAGLLNAVSEILESHTIGDDTWAQLKKTLSEQQLIDVVVTTGAYTINSMATNSFKIALEEGIEREAGLTPSLQ